MDRLVSLRLAETSDQLVGIVAREIADLPDPALSTISEASFNDFLRRLETDFRKALLAPSQTRAALAEREDFQRQVTAALIEPHNRHQEDSGP